MVFASFDGVLLAAAPQAIQVDFDETFLVQLVLFVALTLALKPLLFDPMLKLFEVREKLIDGAKAEARRIDEQSASALGRYEAEMAKARAKGSAERDRVRAEGVKREQQIMSSVKESTARLLEEGKRAARGEAERARAGLRVASDELAQELAARVLGRKVAS
jgi:F-type H+-transporting ATPase subunit b